MTTYKIIRFHQDLSDGSLTAEEVKRGLTLAEAQAHCQREDTHDAESWFDSYAVDQA